MNLKPNTAQIAFSSFAWNSVSVVLVFLLKNYAKNAFSFLAQNWENCFCLFEIKLWKKIRWRLVKLQNIWYKIQLKIFSFAELDWCKHQNLHFLLESLVVFSIRNRFHTKSSISLHGFTFEIKLNRFRFDFFRKNLVPPYNILNNLSSS
jgi:hypothetical protein